MTAGNTSCIVDRFRTSSTPSAIDCKSGWNGHSAAIMEFVGIWHNTSGVTGNRLYATPEARGRTYRSEGALSPGCQGDQGILTTRVRPGRVRGTPSRTPLRSRARFEFSRR